MRKLAWQRYYPDVEGNQEKRQRGEPAVSVMLRPPSSLLWRNFMIAMTSHPAMKDRITDTLIRERGNIERAAVAIIKAATLYDDLAEMLYLPCVGDFENFKTEDGLTIATGAEHWALRGEIDGPDWYTDILGALINRTQLDRGLEAFLASASGSPDSDPETAPAPAGAPELPATSIPS